MELVELLSEVERVRVRLELLKRRNIIVGSKVDEDESWFKRALYSSEFSKALGPEMVKILE